MDAQKQGADALFILLGAVMVLAMHAGFAFLELGTVRKKKPSQCAGKNLGGLLHVHAGLFCCRLWRSVWDQLHGRRANLG